jgi:hypothetical protein
MTVKLNERAFKHAKTLITNGSLVYDDRDAWSEHRPRVADENRFIDEYGYDEYARWYLGIEDAARSDAKSHYKFPYGDFDKVHRCGLLAAESRARQNKYYDIELAVAHLHGMLDGVHGMLDALPATRDRSS